MLRWSDNGPGRVVRAVAPVLVFVAGMLFAGTAAAVGPPAAAPDDPAAVDGAETELPAYEPGEPLDGDLLGELIEHYTWTRDTLLDIARADRLGLPELLAANPGVDRWLPGTAQRLILPTRYILPDAPRAGIVVNTAELRLYYFHKDGWIESFPIGVGRDAFTTPLGTTRVVRKQADPVWYPTENTRKDRPDLPAMVPAGPDNPLGEFALYLGWPTYLIHGTDQPWGVGRRVSRGCIRLYPEDISWLFEQVPTGTPVTVVHQPVKLGRDGEGALYLEVHPSLIQIDELEETGFATPDPLPDMTDDILFAAGDDIPRLDWAAIDRAMQDRTGLPVRILR